MIVWSLISLALAGFALFTSLLIGWRVRRANRELWAAVESVRRIQDREQWSIWSRWQRMYGRLLALEHGMNKPVRLTAQHAEDVFLIDYFSDISSLVYVEVGAYDGVLFSNTYALEQLGAKGMLVEANPDHAASCNNNRPRAIVEHAAVGGPDAEGTISFNIVDGVGADLLSFVEADSAHLARCQNEGSGIRTVTVPHTSLGNLCSKHAIHRIDFLSIDIEGGEIKALKGLDFQRIRPRLILLEANHQEARDDRQQFMNALDYRELQTFGSNILFEDARVLPVDNGDPA